MSSLMTPVSPGQFLSYIILRTDDAGLEVRKYVKHLPLLGWAGVNGYESMSGILMYAAISPVVLLDGRIVVVEELESEHLNRDDTELRYLIVQSEAVARNCGQWNEEIWEAIARHESIRANFIKLLNRRP